MKYISLPFLVFFSLIVYWFVGPLSHLSGEDGMVVVPVLLLCAILWPIAFGINLILVIKCSSKKSRARLDDLFLGLNIALTVLVVRFVVAMWIS